MVTPLRIVRPESQWFRRVSSAEASDVRLICFPGEGATAATFAGWAEKVPPHVEVLAVELPGRGTRDDEVPRRELEPLVEQLGRALCHELSDAPVVFFGHRNGGLVAFALCQHLATHQLPGPVRLVVSQTRPPEGFPSPGLGSFLAKAQWVPPAPRMNRPRPEEHLDASELEMLEAVGSVPPGVLEDPDLTGEVLPPLEADLALTSRWRPGPAPIPTPIAVLLAEGELPQDEVEQQVDQWSRWTTGSCSETLIPGSSRYVDTHARLFFETLEDLLDLREASGVRRIPSYRQR